MKLGKRKKGEREVVIYMYSSFCFNQMIDKLIASYIDSEMMDELLESGMVTRVMLV